MEKPCLANTLAHLSSTPVPHNLVGRCDKCHTDSKVSQEMCHRKGVNRLYGPHSGLFYFFINSLLPQPSHCQPCSGPFPSQGKLLWPVPSLTSGTSWWPQEKLQLPQTPCQVLPHLALTCPNTGPSFFPLTPPLPFACS